MKPMKYLKKFESVAQPEITKSQIEYWFITTFNSEKDFNQWCMDMDGDNIPYDNIVGYNIPKELNVPTYNDKYTSMIGDVLTDINLDDPKYKDLRSGEVTYDEWKEINKYNL